MSFLTDDMRKKLWENFKEECRVKREKVRSIDVEYEGYHYDVDYNDDGRLLDVWLSMPSGFLVDLHKVTEILTPELKQIFQEKVDFLFDDTIDPLHWLKKYKSQKDPA